MFLNSCTNNSVIYEKDNICMVKDMYARLELPEFCYNDHYFYNLLYILLNIFIYIVPLFLSLYVFLKSLI